MLQCWWNIYQIVSFCCCYHFLLEYIVIDFAIPRNMHIIPMGPPCALNWWCAFDDCISMSTSHVWLPPNYLRWAADIRCHLDVFLLIHCFLVGPGERGGDGIWRDLPRWELEAKHPLNPTNTTNTTTNPSPPFFATQNNTEFYASSTSLEI